MPGLINRVLGALSQDVKEGLKNPFTLWLYRYLVLRPQMKRISGITIELTDRCNLRCSYCPKSQGIGVPGGDLDFALFTRLVDEACALIKVRQIALVGFGEPLLYPALDETIRYIKGKDPAIGISLTSNACLLDAERGRKLLETGLDRITLSLNAFSREKYLRLNNADMYDMVVANIKEFLQQANSRGTTRVALQILTGLNRPEEIQAFREFWKPHLGKVGAIQVQPLVNWGGLLKPRSEAQHQLPKGGGGEAKKRYPCIHIQNTWIISRHGEALPCCAVFPENLGDLTLGNVREKSLKNLFMEGRILELRRMNKQGLLEQLKPCKRCDHYQSYPNVFIRNPLYPCLGDRWL